MSNDKKDVLIHNINQRSKKFIRSFEQFYNDNKNYIDNIIDYDEKEKYFRRKEIKQQKIVSYKKRQKERKEN